MDTRCLNSLRFACPYQPIQECSPFGRRNAVQFYNSIATRTPPAMGLRSLVCDLWSHLWLKVIFGGRRMGASMTQLGVQGAIWGAPRTQLGSPGSHLGGSQDPLACSRELGKRVPGSTWCPRGPPGDPQGPPGGPQDPPGRPQGDQGSAQRLPRWLQKLPRSPRRLHFDSILGPIWAQNRSKNRCRFQD